MPLLVQNFNWGVGRAVALLFLQMRRHVPDTPGRLDSLFLGILVVPPWFGQGPWVRGHCSSAGGHSKSSIALVEGDLALSDRHIICSRNKMDDSVCCWGMGSAGHGLSI